MDITASDLHGGGDPFAALAYSGSIQPAGPATNPAQPLPPNGSVFADYPGNANIYYCQTSSDFAKSIFVGSNLTGTASPCAQVGQPDSGFGGRQDPPDLTGTNVPLTASDYGTYASARKPTYGEPAEYPTMAGAVVFSYNPNDLPGLNGNRLNLSRWTYCAIVTGVVTDFNDPSITADNGQSVTNGTSLPIQFFYRSDPSGTNFALQQHLSSACAGKWSGRYQKAPYEGVGRHVAYTGSSGETWSGPSSGSFSETRNNIDEEAAILNTHGGFGYVNNADARQTPALGIALLQNRAQYYANTQAFTDATPQTITKSISTARIVPGTGPAQESIPTGCPLCIQHVSEQSYRDSSVSGAYPIVGISYLLFYGMNNAHVADVTSLIKFIGATGGTSDQDITNAGFAPLTPYLKTGLAQFNHAGRMCVR